MGGVDEVLPPSTIWPLHSEEAEPALVRACTAASTRNRSACIFVAVLHALRGFRIGFS